MTDLDERAYQDSMADVTNGDNKDSTVKKSTEKKLPMKKKKKTAKRVDEVPEDGASQRETYPSQFDSPS